METDRKYLKKTITESEMRDFFHDNARDREFEANKAEIINGISDNVEQNAEKTEEKQEDIMDQLTAIAKQLKELQTEIKKVQKKTNNNNNNNKQNINVRFKGQDMFMLNPKPKHVLQRKILSKQTDKNPVRLRMQFSE